MEFKFKCPICEETHIFSGNKYFRCGTVLMSASAVFTSKIVELEKKIDELAGCTLAIAKGLPHKDKLNSQTTGASTWKCPHCEQLFLNGVVTINGDRFYCKHCRVWFREEDGKFIRTDWVGLKLK